jgi:hypothetical protein
MVRAAAPWEAEGVWRSSPNVAGSADSGAAISNCSPQPAIRGRPRRRTRCTDEHSSRRPGTGKRVQAPMQSMQHRPSPPCRTRKVVVSFLGHSGHPPSWEAPNGSHDPLVNSPMGVASIPEPLYGFTQSDQPGWLQPVTSGRVIPERSDSGRWYLLSINVGPFAVPPAWTAEGAPFGSCSTQARKATKR